MHVQGLVDLGLMSLWQDALRHHFGNLPDFSANTITDTDPYRFLGRSARQPFVHGPTGEDLGCFNGTVIWFETSTNEYHVNFLEDGDELGFAEAEVQIAMGRYDEYIRRAAVPPPNPGQRIQDPERVLFDALCAQPGSFEDNVRHGGGLWFVANKFREGSLFDIRNSNLVPPMPPPTQFSSSGIA
jgi:hypothetical protein